MRMTNEKIAKLRVENPALKQWGKSGHVTPNGAQHKRNGRQAKEERIKGNK